MNNETILRNRRQSQWQFSGRLLLLGITLLLFSMPLLAQQTGDVGGRVTNAADGAGIEGASIIATSPVLPGERTTTTSSNGDYRLPLLPPGTYTH